MSLNSKYTWLICSIITNLICIGILLNLPDKTVVKSVENLSEINELITKELSYYTEDSVPLKKYIPKNTSREIYRLSLEERNFNVAEVVLRLQKACAPYDIHVHGRTNLPEVEWRIHFLYQKQIVQTLLIEVNKNA